MQNPMEAKSVDDHARSQSSQVRKVDAVEECRGSDTVVVEHEGENGTLHQGERQHNLHYLHIPNAVDKIQDVGEEAAGCCDDALALEGMGAPLREEMVGEDVHD
jgi:hypothetical protein